MCFSRLQHIWMHKYIGRHQQPSRVQHQIEYVYACRDDDHATHRTDTTDSLGESAFVYRFNGFVHFIMYYIIYGVTWVPWVGILWLILSKSKYGGLRGYTSPAIQLQSAAYAFVCVCVCWDSCRFSLSYFFFVNRTNAYAVWINHFLFLLLSIRLNSWSHIKRSALHIKCSMATIYYIFLLACKLLCSLFCEFFVLHQNDSKIEEKKKNHRTRSLKYITICCWFFLHFWQATRTKISPINLAMCQFYPASYASLDWKSFNE